MNAFIYLAGDFSPFLDLLDEKQVATLNDDKFAAKGIMINRAYLGRINSLFAVIHSGAA